MLSEKIIVLAKNKGESLVLVELGVEEEWALPRCRTQPPLMEDSEPVRNLIHDQMIFISEA